MWFYMPLMHSESLADHQILMQNVADLRSILKANGDEKAALYVGQTINFAQKHTDILQKFGRYPYRNKHLGRETTDAEQKWLDGGGETFGS